MNSIFAIKIPTVAQLSEVKLEGNLDLSMWRGEDDDDDKDSSIDYPISQNSPPAVVKSSNPINDILAQPQSSSFTSAAIANFLRPEAQTVDFRSQSAASDVTEASDISKVNANKKTSQHLSESHIKHQRGVDNQATLKEHEKFVDGGQQIDTNEYTKGGAKKVEFSEVAVVKTGINSSDQMSAQKEKKLSDSSEKGPRKSRSTSVNLLTEIRKMSLASQDAEDEKKKLAASGQLAVSSKKGSRKSRRKKKHEEEYTDKDRAAAVTLGSKDIKQSLKAKKKRERRMHLSIDFLSSEEYLASMLVTEASYQLRCKKQPSAALAILNKALEIQPTHKGALVARSQCHLKLGDANSALKDAQASFDQNETFMQGLFQYAECLYQLGEFEKALIAFHQGYRLRKDIEGFRIGVQKSQQAIRSAIGDPSATKMGNLEEILTIIEELEESKKKASSTCKEEDILMNIVKRKFGEKAISLQKSKSKPMTQWITREVLGQMYLDKAYLAKFIHRPDVKKQMGNADALRENAKEALKYLESREKFWRQQNPLYARKGTANVIKQHSLIFKMSSSATTLEIPKIRSRSQTKEGNSSLSPKLKSLASNQFKNRVDANNNPGQVVNRLPKLVRVNSTMPQQKTGHNNR